MATAKSQRYIIREDKDLTWSIIDAEIDKTVRDNRIITGLAEVQARHLVVKLNLTTGDDESQL